MFLYISSEGGGWFALNFLFTDTIYLVFLCFRNLTELAKICTWLLPSPHINYTLHWLINAWNQRHFIPCPLHSTDLSISKSKEDLYCMLFYVESSSQFPFRMSLQKATISFSPIDSRIIIQQYFSITLFSQVPWSCRAMWVIGCRLLLRWWWWWC